MSRKAQSLPITIIIIAVLCLIVMIILLAAFGNKVKDFGGAMSTCKGYCAATSTCDSGYVGVPTKNCKDGVNPTLQGDGVCCTKLA